LPCASPARLPPESCRPARAGRKDTRRGVACAAPPESECAWIACGAWSHRRGPAGEHPALPPSPIPVPRRAPPPLRSRAGPPRGGPSESAPVWRAMRRHGLPQAPLHLRVKVEAPASARLRAAPRRPLPRAAPAPRRDNRPARSRLPRPRHPFLCPPPIPPPPCPPPHHPNPQLPPSPIPPYPPSPPTSPPLPTPPESPPHTHTHTPLLPPGAAGAAGGGADPAPMEAGALCDAARQVRLHTGDLRSRRGLRDSARGSGGCCRKRRGPGPIGSRLVGIRTARDAPRRTASPSAPRRTRTVPR
jgi:hypothetical protein